MDDNNKTVSKLQLDFIAEIKQKIREAQYEAMKSVNVHLLNLYWEIGKSIAEKQQEGWGKAVVPTLGAELQKEFPGATGFSVTNLWAMAQFYTEYHDVANLQPLVGEISWAKHIVILNKCKDNLERRFYIQATKKFGWTKNVLIHNIEGKTYDDKEYFIDLLLYHRGLQCLVAVELKIGEFQPEYKGKMEFYLAMLNDKVKMPNENDAIGIIIYKEKNRTVVEYSLRTSTMPIGVATYTTSSNLPESYHQLLPDGATIAQKLDDYFGNEIINSLQGY